MITNWNLFQTDSNWSIIIVDEEFRLTFKEGKTYQYIYFNPKENKYHYCCNNAQLFSVKNLKINGTKYKPIVDHTIQIKINSPEQYKCDDTWYLIKNYKDSSGKDCFLAFTDEDCTQEKLFSSGNVNAVQDNSKTLLYLTLRSGETPLFITEQSANPQFSSSTYNTCILNFVVNQNIMKINDEKYELEIN